MILSGRSVDAQEALSWGLANSVVAEGKALSAAVEYAFNLSLFPQLCLQKDRDMVYRFHFTDIFVCHSLLIAQAMGSSD